MPPSSPDATPGMIRVGMGYDSHRFAPGRPLILGGVQLPHEQGLMGHSDADVVAHALTDALLGAAGLGDIGAMFPPTDPAWAGADSIDLLARAHAATVKAGWRLVQADITVVAEAPRIAPHAGAMAARLGGATDGALVSVKGKTNEGMGFVGRGEGIAALAVALLGAT